MLRVVVLFKAKIEINLSSLIWECFSRSLAPVFWLSKALLFLLADLVFPALAQLSALLQLSPMQNAAAHLHVHCLEKKFEIVIIKRQRL
jgi:hypothetical protein